MVFSGVWAHALCAETPTRISHKIDDMEKRLKKWHMMDTSSCLFLFDISGGGCSVPPLRIFEEPLFSPLGH
jgi:hypothetical protein